MLTKEDNELMTRVGPGTPMGNLLRQFWIPVLFSWELVADGSPERVRLLGEDLVAFRDTDGRVGMIAENCPHRGASLYFGRNEEAGLRCIYHGWKFDCEGHCVDMPNEPEDTRFADKVRIKSYPCIEKTGFIWTYMGPERPAPPLPHLEWMDLPEEHHIASKRVQYSNWVQAMEGDIDQSHVSFVHSSLNIPEDDDAPSNNTAGAPFAPRNNIARIRAADKHPRFEIVDTDYGCCIGAGREAGDGQKYWRLTQWLMPFHTMTGPYGPDPTRNWRAWVPIDDYTTYVIGLSFHPMHPIPEAQRANAGARGGVWNISKELREPKTSKPFGGWRPIPSLENDFFQDRESQKKDTYSGISEFWAQDAAPQLSMGPIFQRQYEHLGTSDRAIIKARSRLIKSAKALRDEGATPAEVWNPECYAIRSDALFLPPGEDWFEATTERRKATPGINPDCA
jgi:phenylpropionate dioxygenase-like ring-hydroxylating dioxygenase large terminal subunit